MRGVRDIAGPPRVRTCAEAPPAPPVPPQEKSFTIPGAAVQDTYVIKNNKIETGWVSYSRMGLLYTKFSIIFPELLIFL